MIELAGSGVEKVSDSFRFLSEIKQDHPGFAASIIQKLPKWKRQVDRYFGKTGVADYLLSHFDYISHNEEEHFLGEISTEVSSDIEKFGHIYFVSYAAKDSGSGKLFFEQIKQRLSPEEQEKIEIINALDVEETLFRENPGQYYFVDDSTNSGKQFIDSILGFSTYATAREKQGFLKNIFSHRRNKKPNLKVRFLRMTHDANANVARHYNLDLIRRHVDFDIQSKNFVTGEDLCHEMSEIFDIDDRKLDIIRNSNHGKGGAVLGCFFHRIQDNLSPLFLSGGRNLEEVDPLFSGDEIKKTY